MSVLEQTVKVGTLRVAIDGPAGAGKSTVARRVAEALGLTYVDTGAMYRALTWAVLKAGIAPEDTEGVCALAAWVEIRLEPGGRVWADGQEVSALIRTPQISGLTSALSAMRCVRARLTALQRDMARRGGVVMEGRDIGTVVMPDAEVKIFLTASLGARAERRRLELAGRGVETTQEALEREIGERDARDGSRDAAPMTQAGDAVAVDTDGLGPEEVVERILMLCRGAGRG